MDIGPRGKMRLEEPSQSVYEGWKKPTALSDASTCLWPIKKKKPALEVDIFFFVNALRGSNARLHHKMTVLS